ncbi:short-chain dehydrogenase/reductase SDR [Coprinopsis cinerea okayama7|uniref:Short-chain dehydrogenase/reductase SDR n=1 Tax=Coprinopsis cinerea (strain Okayama-7 / 130 / ATCC MYA-4618 / FGSC 9003) TaxID=240176 RepID=A8P1Z5_COPC7|nr:short-chain dehydrogenase/reductase SDR [Coprinopsis cinerea okayama7\|eukprot:XP_001838206.2 short-chain dehydrogenase/reductase SDR [Coprinopsis cinerea okayama7\
MAANAAKRVLVVAGLGTGAGTGAATARLFAQKGYNVALIARGADSVNKLSEEINAAGGKAAPFTVSSYSSGDISTVWSDIRKRFPKPEYDIRAAVWNAGEGIWKPFLEITADDVQRSLDTNVAAAFAFSREAILSFKGNDIDSSNGKRGILIFTGATASLRGNVTTSAFAAGKHGARALSQSLAKEFGKDNIHVSHVIIDGGILTDRSRQYRNDPKWEQNEDVRLNPESIANSYLYLANQDRSAWTWELDLRPAHEKW